MVSSFVDMCQRLPATIRETQRRGSSFKTFMRVSDSYWLSAQTDSMYLRSETETILLTEPKSSGVFHDEQQAGKESGDPALIGPVG
jgi:hypothetical protein